MTRVELAREISEELGMSFEKALRDIDASMDDEFGVSVNEIPVDFSEAIRAGFREAASY